MAGLGGLDTNLWTCVMSTRVIVTKVHVRGQGLALYPLLNSRDLLGSLRVMMVEAALRVSEQLEP